MKATKKFIILLALLIISCGKSSDTPKGCVTEFIIAVEQHDMSAAWPLLSNDAQGFYNSIGEKERKSGKGALENEINNIKRFKSLKTEYSIRHDKENADVVKIGLAGGTELSINTMNENGYKIKDGASVRNILNGIAAEHNKKEGY